MYPHAIALARRLEMPLIGFDLEHTGGKGRGITEFGATVVTPEGQVHDYVSLVKPREECPFVPFVCRLTGIWPEMVETAPRWASVLEQFVLPNKKALWIGFNSRVADMPIIRNESLAVGVDTTDLLHLDLMRFGELTGSLTTRVASLWPDAQITGAHRALADSRFTMMLLEGLLRDGEPLGDKITSGAVCLKQHQNNPAAEKTKRPSGKRLFDGSFLVKDGSDRNGQPWTDSEKIWVKSQFKKGKTPLELGQSNGRSPYAIAWRLFSEGLIDKQARESFKQA